MSLETEKAALLTAVTAMTDAVAQKSTAIKAEIAAHEQDLQATIDTRDIDGDVGYQGVVRRTIFQGFISGTDRLNANVSGDFPTPPNFGTNANIYVHFKTPMNINRDSHMFWFNILGYVYGSSKIADETIVGYCYAVTKSLTNKSAVGNLSPDSYVDSNGNVILRLLLPSIYYTTLRIDTMQVGDGPLFEHGALEVKYSTTATVTFT